jgi:hypothetical protein
MGADKRPPAAFSQILHSLDPVNGGKSIAIARDLLGSHFPKQGFVEAGAFLDRLLADPAISNADLKGLLNRETASSWAVEFEFGSDAKAARRYLEALRQALAQELA